MFLTNQKRGIQYWIHLLTLLSIVLGAMITPTSTIKATDSDYISKLQWMSPDPYFVDADASGNVYVAGRHNNMVYKYDTNGLQILTWGGSGSGDGEFNDPEGISVDNVRGFVYLTDSGNNRVQKFDLNGVYKAKWGSYGSGDGQFNAPAGIAVDSSGNVYVTDRENNRIQKFDSNGGFITKWGSSGTGSGLFNMPESIAVDNEGNIYVGDEENNRVQRFDSNHNFISMLGTIGSGDGQFIDPEDVAVDTLGNVYVADSDNSRIQKFDKNGVLLAKWGISGTGEGQLLDPRGVAIDGSGNVYIADTGNSRIQKFISNIGALKVTVKDPSGKIIAGAIVYSTTAPTGQTALKGTTDAGGVIAFNDILPGGYTLRASKTGYVNTTSNTLTVTAGGTLTTTLTLTPAAPTTSDLKVTVKDSKGAPLAGASVSATSVPSGQNPLTSTTTADGTSVFSGVKPGSYTLQASKNGHVTATSTVTVTAGSAAEATITLNTAKGSLKLTVSDSRGPIKGAIVTLPPEAGSELALTTGDDGTVTFRDINLGSYSVKITMTGYIAATQTVTVAAEEAVTASVTLQPEAPATGSLKVTVKDQDGHPLGGADVSLESQPAGAKQLTGSTNNDGVAVFTGVTPGGYVINAKKSGYTRVGGGVGVNVVSGSTLEVTITLTGQQAQESASILPYVIAVGAVILLIGAVFLWSRSRRQLKLIYSFGVDGKNVLDTFTETFTRGTATGQPTTVKMKLAAAELDKIETKLKEIGFFDKPDSQLLPSGDVVESRASYESYCLKVKLGDRVRELRWNSKTIYDGDASKKLDEVNALMSKIIESK